jgi:hypothetical protein
MALESQGVLIRRESTVAASTAITSTNTLSVSSADGAIYWTGGDFTVDFSTGMIIEFTDGCTENENAYTIAEVAATKLTLYEPVTDKSSGTSITIEGHDFTNIGEIVSWTGPTGSANIIDVTNLQSTAKNKLIGLRDEGNISMDFFLNTSADQYQMALKDDRATRALRRFHIKLTDTGTSLPTSLYLRGYVTNFSISGAVDDAIKGSMTVEITSAVKWIYAV